MFFQSEFYFGLFWDHTEPFGVFFYNFYTKKVRKHFNVYHHGPQTLYLYIEYRIHIICHIPFSIYPIKGLFLEILAILFSIQYTILLARCIFGWVAEARVRSSWHQQKMGQISWVCQEGSSCTSALPGS